MYWPKLAPPGIFLLSNVKVKESDVWRLSIKLKLNWKNIEVCVGREGIILLRTALELKIPRPPRMTLYKPHMVLFWEVLRPVIVQGWVWNWNFVKVKEFSSLSWKPRKLLRDGLKRKKGTVERWICEGMGLKEEE